MPQKAVSFRSVVLNMLVCVEWIFLTGVVSERIEQNAKKALGAYVVFVSGANLPVGTREPARCGLVRERTARRRFDCESVPPQTSAWSVASRIF